MRKSIGYRPLEQDIILVVDVLIRMSNDFGQSACMTSEMVFTLVDQSEGERLADFFNDQLNSSIKPMRIMCNHIILKQYGNGWNEG